MITSKISVTKEKTSGKGAVCIWYKKLRKWQKGGLIGCAIGLVFAGLTLLGLQQYHMGALPWDWVLRFHSLVSAIYIMILSIRPYAIADLATAVSIVIIYGVFGIIIGRFQQISNQYIRWVFTGLSAILLLLIYWFNFQAAILFENI